MLIKYKLNSGEIQCRTATLTVTAREWRQHWLKWTSSFAMIQKTVDYRFSDEVGERTGSWKGGTIASGEEIRKGETPIQAFRRMEATCKF